MEEVPPIRCTSSMSAPQSALDTRGGTGEELVPPSVTRTTPRTAAHDARGAPPPLRRPRRAEIDADHLQPARERGEGERIGLLARVAEDLEVLGVRAGRHEHAGGDRDQLHELVLDALLGRRVPRRLLQVPGAV